VRMTRTLVELMFSPVRPATESPACYSNAATRSVLAKKFSGSVRSAPDALHRELEQRLVVGRRILGKALQRIERLEDALEHTVGLGYGALQDLDGVGLGGEALVERGHGLGEE